MHERVNRWEEAWIDIQVLTSQHHTQYLVSLNDEEEDDDEDVDDNNVLYMSVAWALTPPDIHNNISSNLVNQLGKIVMIGEIWAS